MELGRRYAGMKQAEEWRDITGGGGQNFGGIVPQDGGSCGVGAGGGGNGAERYGQERKLNPGPLSVVVDIGAKSTDMGIVREGQLIFAQTIPTAGDAFTRAIETGLGLDHAQAEQYKNTYGMNDKQLEENW